MRKYILIPIIIVCVFGCGKKGLEDKIKSLENENKDLGVKLQKQGTDLESSSDVIKDVTALIEVIQETEMEIEGKKHLLSKTTEMESTVDMKEEILNSIRELYDDLKRHREKAVELQEKLDSFAAGNTQQNEIISSLKNELEEKGIKVEELARKNFSLKKNVTHLESELDIKKNEISRKELEIKNLHQEINSIFYVIGNGKELRRKKIIAKEGITLMRSLKPFRRNYILGEDFTLAEFTHEKSILTEFRIDGKIKTILPYRNKSNYEITYENGLSVINITDSKNFWHQKYLVIVTK